VTYRGPGLDKYEAAAELDRRAAAPEGKATPDSTGRRTGDTTMSAMTVGRGVLDVVLKAAAAVVAAAVIGSVVWYSSVNSARDKVGDHSERLRAIEQKAEATDRRLEGHEIRTAKDIEYIRVKLTEIAASIEKLEHRERSR
jgi:hypothetical protein